MARDYANVATPFLPGRTNEFPSIGYDCSCEAPSVYRIAVDTNGKNIVFSLCPRCDNIRNPDSDRFWNFEIAEMDFPDFGIDDI